MVGRGKEEGGVGEGAALWSSSKSSDRTLSSATDYDGEDGSNDDNLSPCFLLVLLIRPNIPLQSSLAVLVSDVAGAGWTMQAGASVAEWLLSISARKLLNNCQVVT